MTEEQFASLTYEEHGGGDESLDVERLFCPRYPRPSKIGQTSEQVVT